MSGEFGSFRFGWDGPNRIGTSTVLMQEAGELLPGELLHTQVPFLPVITNGDGSSGNMSVDADGHAIWKSYPSRCDLYFYQGDDVVIPLYFNDPERVNDNMETGYEWFAQIRVRHSWKSALHADFSINVAFHPSTPPGEDLPDVDDEYTMVEMFLPRGYNDLWGIFEWEIYSRSVSDMSRFPKPSDWPEDTPWPEPDVIKTWLYGRCIIAPRTTSTDMLPLDPGVVTLGVNGIVFAPNGALSTAGNPSIGITAFGDVLPVPQP